MEHVVWVLSRPPRKVSPQSPTPRMHKNQQKQFVHISDIQRRPAFFVAWERLRHGPAHWIVECVAEFVSRSQGVQVLALILVFFIKIGVYLYVYFGMSNVPHRCEHATLTVRIAGVGSQAAMVVGGLTGQPALGCTFYSHVLPHAANHGYLIALLQVGLAYAIGVVLALSIAGPTSGGHLNPCVTIAFALFRGFPWKKVPRHVELVSCSSHFVIICRISLIRYICAQLLGAYVSCLVIYLQYKGTLTVRQSLPHLRSKESHVSFT